MSRNTKAYIMFTLAGLFLGYLFFGVSDKMEDTKNDAVSVNQMGRWTCSMHPEVDGTENGTCPLCAMDLVYVDNKEGSFSDSQFQMSDEAVAIANIQTTEVTYSNLNTVELTLSGKVTTNEETDAVQTTLFDGRLEDLYTNTIGKKVIKGQEIGKIYSPELFLAQDKLLTSVSYRDTHPKLYASARNSLGLWKMTDEQVEQVLKEGKPMVDFPLYADVTGTVTEVMGKKGNYYAQGTPLFKVSRLSSVWVVFDAYERHLGLLKENQDIAITFEGFPGKSIETNIDLIEPIMQRDSRTLAVRVVVDNKQGWLRPGMFAKGQVKILVPEGQKHLTVPKSAVLWTGKRSIVYKKVKGHQNVFEIAEVQLGHSYNENYQILEGLDVADVVVTNGAFTIDAAAQLNGKKSMLNMPKMETNRDMHMAPLKDAAGKIKVSESAKDDFEVFIKHYMVLKDALIASDFEEAQNAVMILKANFEKIIGAYPETAKEQLSHMNKSLESIETAPTIEAQRKAFKHLSEYTVNLALSFSGYDQPIYLQHCDCVDGFTGADWLSLNENVLNPYFGDAMLTCGRVTQVLN